MKDKYKAMVDFLFEVGMLKKTPRTGYQFLGTGKENVAEHSFRTAIIAFVLAKNSGKDAYKAALMALFHDLHEARCGDFNYVYRIYNKSDERQALKDSLQDTGIEEEVLDFYQELEEVKSVEAALVQDADQLDLILNLKEQLDLGNKYAAKWLDCALKRLRTEEGKKLAQKILQIDHTDWWFKTPDPSWWTKKNGQD